MKIEIRILDESYAVAYMALRLYSYQEAPTAFSESYEDECKRTVDEYGTELRPQGAPVEVFALGAFTSTGELVGFVTFKRDRRWKARHKAMIHAMYVHPEYRQHHVGAALMKEIIDRARAMPGLEQMHLWVLHGDAPASGFYKKAGFESQGTLVKNDLKINGQYVDAEYMVMYLG